MAKMKVSILNSRRSIPELNCISPVYAREIDTKKIATIIRSGFIVVDAADLTPIGLEQDGITPKKLAAAASPGAGAVPGVPGTGSPGGVPGGV